MSTSPGIGAALQRARLDQAKERLAEVLDGATLDGGVAFDVVDDLQRFLEGYGLALFYIPNDLDGKPVNLTKEIWNR